MKKNMYTGRQAAMNYLTAITYGGLAELSEIVANVVFGLAVIALVVMIIKGWKIAEVFRGENGKFSFKLAVFNCIIILVGLILGHLLMKSMLKILV